MPDCLTVQLIAVIITIIIIIATITNISVRARWIVIQPYVNLISPLNTLRAAERNLNLVLLRQISEY